MKGDKTEVSPGIKWTLEIWQAAEKLTSPRSEEREKSLEFLTGSGLVRKSPLLAYIIATRITDPDLETRFHFVQAIGSILVVDEDGKYASDDVLIYLHAVFANLSRDQILRLLAVGEQYLSAEESLESIFRLCSYAGNLLSGIVNDQKVPISIRQQAIYFCGEAGFLDTAEVMQGLVNRVEKRAQDSKERSLRKRDRDEELLHPYAIAALAKLGS